MALSFCMFVFNQSKRSSMYSKLVALLIFYISSTVVHAQKLTDSLKKQQPAVITMNFGKGIQFNSTDGLFTLALSGRIQSLSETKYDVDKKTAAVDFLIRRCRLSFQGTAFNPKFTYRIQFGFSQGDITASNIAEQNNLILRDAMLYYQASKWLRIGFGQTKLPGNRQRQISSSSLQLVERSISNNNFTLDRDKGIWLFSKFNIDKSLFKSTITVSSGDGRIVSNKNGKPCYTSRLEWLPMGDFANSADYIEADVEKEFKPKLSVAVVVSYNQDNNRTLGQLGDYLYNYETSNLFYYGADAYFKYKGFSAEAEWYNRKSDKGIITNSSNIAEKNFALSGTGFLIQSGYFVSDKNEIAARYSSVHPAEKIKSVTPVSEEYVMGFSHYFKKHSLKIQTDFTYLIVGDTRTIIHRLSGVITF